MKKILLYILIPIISLSSLYGQQPSKDQIKLGQTITLLDCIESAMLNSFDIQIGMNNVDIAKNNVNPSVFLPIISATGKNTQTINNSNTWTSNGEQLHSEPNLSNYSASANLSWTLFDGLKMFASYKKQKELLADGELAFRSRVENLTKDICSQYYLIICLQNQVSLLEQLLETSRMRYNQALLRYNIGKDSGLEFKQAKLDLNSDSSRFITQKEAIANAYIELYRLINFPFDADRYVADTITLGKELILEELKEKTLANNTSILRSQKGEDISKLDLKIAQAARYPSLNAGSGYSYNYNQSSVYPSEYNKINGFNWGLTLSVPIFNGTATSNKIKNAHLQQDNAKLSVMQTQQNVLAQLFMLYNNYKNNIQLIVFESQSAEVAAINLDAAMAKYKIGSISGIQYRDIQISYLNAADRKLKAEYQAKLSEIQLQLLSGDLF